MRWLWRSTAFGILAGFLWQGAYAEKLADATIVANFDIVAFRNEFVDVENPRVTKWSSPLRIRVHEDVPLDDGPRRVLTDHMTRLGRLTGIDIGYVDDPEASNYTIVFTRRAKYEDYVRHHSNELEGRKQAQLIRRMRGSNCLGLYSVDRGTYAIKRSVVVIPVDHTSSRALLARCIIEETTQTMGLPNDDDDVNPSIFNDRSVLKDLSRHDELLLRLLYDPRLTPGMPREEALRVARRILPELRR